MKQTCKRLALLLTAVLLTLSLAACGKKIPQGDYVPTAVIYADGSQQPYEEYVQYYLDEELAIDKEDPTYESIHSALNFVYTFGKEGEVSRDVGGYVDEGDYTLEGDQMTMHFNEVTIEATYDADADTVTFRNGGDVEMYTVMSHRE